MEFLTVLGKTVLLRSYVFVPLMLALAMSVSLMAARAARRRPLLRRRHFKSRDELLDRGAPDRLDRPHALSAGQRTAVAQAR